MIQAMLTRHDNVLGVSQVVGIVDKAVKEMSMEKVLKELDVTWKTMEFEHDKHPRRSITLLRASEELIETLEDNQVRR